MSGLKPAVVLGGLANALSVTRSLGSRGVPVFYYGDSGASTRLSRFCVASERVPPGPSNRYLGPLVRGPREGVVIPCGDDALEFVAERRPEIEKLGYVPFEANDELLLKMLDKEQTYEIARSHGIPAPRTRAIEDVQEFREAVSDFGLPAALKPRVSHDYARHFAGKAFVITDPIKGEQLFRRADDLGLDMLFTEIIPGREGTYWGYYIYVDDRGAPLFQFTKRKLRQYPLGFGLGTLHRMDHNPEVIDSGWSFVKAAGLRGLVNVEFKLDERDQRYVLIECNHRITAANELIRRAGVDLAWFVYQRLVGGTLPPMEVERTDLALWWPMRDIAAAVRQIRSGELTIREWRAGLSGRVIFPTVQISDPAPVLAAFARSARNVGRHLRRVVRA